MCEDGISTPIPAETFKFLKWLGVDVYVSDWSKMIFQSLMKQVEDGSVTELSAQTQLRMIDYKKHKFVPVGEGAVTLSKEGFRIVGTINREPVALEIPVLGIPTLPFSPGKHFEIQNGKTIYRCVLTDGNQVMKFINLVKILYLCSHRDCVPEHK